MRLCADARSDKKHPDANALGDWGN